jgi:hypothetical protein
VRLPVCGLQRVAFACRPRALHGTDNEFMIAEAEILTTFNKVEKIACFLVQF